MKSGAHAAISLVVAAAALAVTAPPMPAWAVVAVAVGVGVGIDVDHFLIARWRSGDWAAVRRCIRNPSIVVFDQTAIFDPGEVGAVRRLLSHHLLGGPAVALLWVASPYVAGLVAASLYMHVLADLIDTARHVVVVPEAAEPVTTGAGASAPGAADAGTPRPDEDG